MRSAVPKVLHPVAGRPLLGWVLRAARAAGCEQIFVVIGHGAERVRQVVAADDVSWVLQKEQKGTGHAVAQVQRQVSDAGTMLVLSGDVPLVSAATLQRLAEAAGSAWGAMAVAELAEPGALGRVMVRDDGTLDRITEFADASPEQRALRRVNAGLYALPRPEIFDFVNALTPDNAKQEFYLTDALNAAAEAGRAVQVVELEDASEALGVNDRADLARVHRLLLLRKANELMLQGVTILDPEGTTIEAGVSVGRDAVIHPGSSLLGGTIVGESCTVAQGAWLRDAVLGEGVVVEPYSVLDGVEIAAGCRIGPFARLRPGAVLQEGAKVGNFVEVKNSQLGRGVKANHLAYVGDATIGDGANLGAGVVTCNYDGVAKHRTEIGSEAFVGSSTMLVAPVRVGDRAMTAAGSVISKDVPPDALAVERSSQKTLPGWGKRRRARKK
jgi:bifunctional UDP-N-acetylglucosamine pyrophosphorylase/glucosamine-1-phosphate N-acetyltransferase